MIVAFLTATPFQLSEGELFAVLELFKNSAVGEAARREFSADCDVKIGNQGI